MQFAKSLCSLLKIILTRQEDLFNNINYIYEFYERKKKLNNTLNKLKNLDLSNPDLKNNIENLSFKKIN